MSDGTSFDIFFGVPEKDAKWLEAVAGLDGAQHRMRQLATQQPGHYFIFNTWNGCIIDHVDTQARPQAQAVPLGKVKVAGAA